MPLQHDNPNLHKSKGVGGMSATIVTYLRKQLRFQTADLDKALDVSPGTVAAAEAGTTPLDAGTVLRLRELVRIAERSQQIPESVHIGMLIRQARTSLRKTQKDVAAGAGMSQAQYSLTEKSASPTTRTLYRIAKAMGIPADWILRGKTPVREDCEDSEKMS